MAELGDFLLGTTDPEVDRVQVDVTMLDYDFVNACSKLSELKAVLKVLKSGKEGRYPHLEKCVEDKVMSMLSEKDRAKVLSMKSNATATEVYDAEKELEDWIGDAKKGDGFKGPTIPSTNTPAPPDTGDIFNVAPPAPPPASATSVFNKPGMAPIRGSREANVKISRDARGMPSHETADPSDNVATKDRLNKESMSNRDYFRAWDKFDVDAEIESLDAEEQAKAIQAKEAREGARVRDEKNRERREKEMYELRTTLNFTNRSEKEREWSSGERNAPFVHTCLWCVYTIG